MAVDSPRRAGCGDDVSTPFRRRHKNCANGERVPFRRAFPHRSRLTPAVRSPPSPEVPVPVPAMRLSTAPSLQDAVADQLLRERIVVLGREVDDEVANQLCAQMLLLAADDPRRDVHLYVNSPGGSVTADEGGYVN